MKVEAWVATDRIGSKCTTTVEIDDEDLVDLTKQEAAAHIDEVVYDEIRQMIEWGWSKK